MSTKRVVLVAVPILVIAVVVVVVLRSRDSVPSFRLTINSWIGWAPLYLAQEKGFFDRLDVELIRVEDTGARKSTMISGKVDGYASSVDNFALDAALGVPGMIVLCFDESFGGDGIVAKSAIESPRDLRGRSVAYQRGLPSHFLLLSVLQRAGLSASDITHVDMDADKAGAAFVAGHVDAAVTWEPWISRAAERSDGHILVTTRDFPGLIVDTLVVRDDVIAERPDDVAVIVSAWFRALEYWEEHKDESDKIMARSYGLDTAEFRDMCSGVRFFEHARNQEYFGTDTSGEIFSLFDAASELWLSTGLISEPVSAESRIDPSFIAR